MKKRLTVFFLFFNSLLLYAEPLHYTLSFDTELFSSVHVRVQIHEPAKRFVLSMPVWVPGSYYVGNFGQYVKNIRASSGSEEVTLRPLNQNSWEVLNSRAAKVTVDYDVQMVPTGFLKTVLDSSGAILEGATIWLEVRGLEETPARITIEVPFQWDVSTALPSVEHHVYRAVDYDQLVDSPIMLGELDVYHFTVQDKLHEVAIKGKGDFDRTGFVEMIQKIVRYQTAFFDQAPYERYVFQIDLLSETRGGGGLEHRSSTTITFPVLSLMEDIKHAANLIAHEFFHLWNVERIFPEQLSPIPYHREFRLRSLWWLEGVTSYYADLTLVRTGIWSADEFFRNQEKQIQILQSNPDRLKTSVAQSSWDIWETGYFSTGISYYVKGQLLALLFDLSIRMQTGQQKSLDDVVIYLNETFARQGRAYAEDELVEIFQRVTGIDFQPFFDRYITGTRELPFEEVFSKAGLAFDMETRPVPTIGNVRLMGDRLRVFSIDPTGPAAMAGLRRNDRMVAIDGIELRDREQFENMIKNKTIGDIVDIEIERNRTRITIPVPVKPFEQVNVQLGLGSNTTKVQNNLLENWLHQ